MTISTIDPATPDPNDVAGQGDDQIRALKQAIVDQFAGEVGDLYDIPITVGPRSLNAVNSKADQADLDATDANVATNTTNIGTNTTNIADHEARIAAIEADYTTSAQALGGAWPVGAIFISADGVNPSAKGLPGTWTAVADGRVLLGASSGFGVDGGNANSEVTLVEANLPQHKHSHSTFRENGTSGDVPAVYRTDPATTFSAQFAGRDASAQQYGIFNTDEGINLSATPTAVDVSMAYRTVRFFERTA